MKDLLKIHSHAWLVVGMMMLALLTLAFAGSDGDVDPVHCYPCRTHTPTPTRTPTFTPTPVIQACRVVGIFFGQETYQVGQTIEITVRVADFRGMPLIGANVDAEVTRQPLSAQAVTDIGLIDRSGDYEGSYSQTENPGDYTFSITVNDPTGSRFLPCSAEATVRVVGSTATPTPTSSVSPTPTPTHTPTSQPGSATVRVNPTNLQTTLCSLRETSNVVVENISNLVGVQLELSYDPTVIQVIDADRSRRGVQVRFDSTFTVESISRNEVDTSRGRIFFTANLLGGRTINGTNGLIAIDWRPQRVGNSAVSLTRAILTNAANQTISATLQSGAVQVNFVPNCRTGTATLQGRADHSGVIVANGVGTQVQTEADGYFAIIAEDRLSFTFPGYLPGQADLQAGLQAETPEGEATQLGMLNLLAGDVNDDQVVNILDLAFLAQRFQSTGSAADLNTDGVVNILDLALVAGNYQQHGPLTTWQSNQGN